MKIKKCPYCGKRASYISLFASRRKGEYVCERCGKESRGVISNKIFIAFSVTAAISLIIMTLWIFAGLINNPLGILLVAIPLIVFAIFSPNFVNYLPLRKYKKSMEAKKAGIEYSDNIIAAELEDKDSFSSSASLENSTKFQINSDVFNKIKAERNAAREKLKGDDIISESSKINSEGNYVPVIENISENHSYDDAPLKKIHSDNSYNVSRNRHYIDNQTDNSEKKKPEGNRYSANRKF